MQTKTAFTKTNPSLVKKVTLLLALLACNFSLFSQTTGQVASTNSGGYSNPFFILFVFVIIFLLVVIIVLADVVKGAAKIFIEKQKSKGKNLLGLVFLLLLGNSVYAQTETAPSTLDYGGLSSGLFYTLSFIVIFEVAIIAALIYFIRSFLQIPEMQKAEALLRESSKVQTPSIIEKLNASVSLEEESEILMDHNYDGIQELDNNLPPWWIYGFYLTIVFSVVYLIHYHVIRTGDLQGAEYTKELNQAAIDIAEYQKKSALSVDENTVKLLVDENALSKGKEIYINNCVACHGKFGEGQVGPNLTDNYWIHGADIQSVFKSIKYGYPDKGMKSWKEDLSASQISFISSYLHTLVGTNPANPKEKQGDFYGPEGGSDSTSTTSVAKDSLKTVVDSLAQTKP
jgi:cytochrome c oxidase cbb3-type subunit 3